jgi:predicted nucleic acid-binding protein
MRIYLDNCCFNRPFDDQSQGLVRIETEAKLHIQDLVRSGVVELAWSYLLDFENEANPFQERRETIGAWKSVAACDVDANDEVIAFAETLSLLAIKPADSLHVACAVHSGCAFFLTTDMGVLKRAEQINEIQIVDPPAFVREFDQ